MDGVSQTITEWGESVGLSMAIISKRLRRGWSDHDALYLPSGTYLTRLVI